MPVFAPFHAIRYALDGPDRTAQCSPPYDVIEPDERAALLRRDAHNAVRLILPDSYEGAAATLRQWLAEGVLAFDAAPAFAVYAMDYDAGDGRRVGTTGVLGALGVQDDASTVMPHERTIPRARSDRLELLRATRANFDPIWGLSLAGGLTNLLMVDDPPVAWAVDDDGVRHRLWPITDPLRTERIARAVGGERIVLADGHHRYATARTYRAERVTAGIDDPGAGAILTFVVELAPEQLRVRAIHRLLRGIGAAAVLAALDGNFTVRRLSGVARPSAAAASDVVAAVEDAMVVQGALGWIDRGGAALLVPRAALAGRLADEPAVLRDVDAARFETGVAPHLGGASVTYRHDAAGAAAEVVDGQAEALVLLRPVAVDTIRAAADTGVLMPQKTTFFTPKPRTGLAFRSLDRP